MPFDLDRDTINSAEKAERSRIGVQIALWNESMSWLGPIREYARASSTIRSRLHSTDDTVAARDAIERRIQFLGWEITTLIEKHRHEAKCASELLNLIFFRELRFAVASTSGRRLEGGDALFDTVLATRVGHSTLIAMLYAWAGETVAHAYGEECDFDRVELVKSTPTEVVRLISRHDTGSVWLVDLTKSGEKVAECDWSIWCSSPASNGFCRITWTHGLIRSLTDLFKSLERTPTSLEVLAAMLYVLDRIISLQPSETSRWAERALLNTRRGDRPSALDDLKRFFAFHDRETAPAAIVSLFDELKEPQPN